METLGAFLSGVAAGWAMRSTVDSGRQVAVQAISFAHNVAERARRWVAIEREFVEDLLAEGKAHYERSRATPAPTRRTGSKGPAVVSTPADESAA